MVTFDMSFRLKISACIVIKTMFGLELSLIIYSTCPRYNQDKQTPRYTQKNSDYYLDIVLVVFSRNAAKIITRFMKHCIGSSYNQERSQIQIWIPRSKQENELRHVSFYITCAYRPFQVLLNKDRLIVTVYTVVEMFPSIVQ